MPSRKCSESSRQSDRFVTFFRCLPRRKGRCGDQRFRGANRVRQPRSRFGEFPEMTFPSGSCRQLCKATDRLTQLTRPSRPRKEAMTETHVDHKTKRRSLRVF
ncbi:hypothetical protein QR680_005231 [Steinernema hermaphroditum]|uniref:Uncharacterized protein n=1 Tax=Steinernema hermaphroditum TaxID=289476 RepID=A0AA39HTH0_9BILA|nr:hypothetical protein QR680_005231 [Steinernema hermaphroditum]